MLILVLSLIQCRLDKRKDARKTAAKARIARADMRGGWWPPPVAGAMVHYERPGAAAVLTIDRPERRNAVDGPTAEALLDGFERFCADEDARVLVLTGAGEDAFCAGADLKAITTLDPRRPARRPAGLQPPDLAEAHHRRDRGLVPGRRLRAGVLVRPADRDRRARASAAPSGAGASR